MLFSFALAFQLALHVIGAAAFSFGGGDEQVVTRNGERAGIPLGGDETARSGEVVRFVFVALQVEYCNGIEPAAGNKKTIVLTRIVLRKGQSLGDCPHPSGVVGT